MMGKGELESSLIALAAELGIADQVEFVAGRTNKEAVAAITNSDLLLLPEQIRWLGSSGERSSDVWCSGGMQRSLWRLGPVGRPLARPSI